MIASVGRPPTRPANPSVVGANVKRLREGRDPRLSQEALADASGLSRATIAAVERGRYPSMDWKTVEKIADGLGVEVSMLTAVFANHGALDPVVQEFLRSHWRTAMNPTDEEILWLQSLPTGTWAGLDPSAETIAMLLRWRRERSRH